MCGLDPDQSAGIRGDDQNIHRKMTYICITLSKITVLSLRSIHDPSFPVFLLRQSAKAASVERIQKESLLGGGIRSSEEVFVYSCQV